MKYIRTKDGIIYTNCLQLVDTNWQVKGKERYIKLNNNHVLKVVDTIEELCDAWIIIPIGVACNPFIINFNEDISPFINYNHIIYSHIYSAIWVKGENNEPILKPVAKMNEKGELELL